MKYTIWAAPAFMYTLQSISVQENIKVSFQMPVPWMTLGPLLELDATSSSQVLYVSHTGFRELSENAIIYEEIFVSYCISVRKIYLHNYWDSGWHVHLQTHQSLKPNAKLLIFRNAKLCVLGFISWDQAREDCHQKGGFLVEIDSKVSCKRWKSKAASYFHLKR